MGLDTTHGAWHGPYSYFHEWRLAIARAANREFNPKATSQFALYGRWNQTPADPLDVLLEHSDCDGVIQWEQCEPLARRLEELLDKLPPDNEDADQLDCYLTRRFIEGLRSAAELKEDVEFH